MKKVGCLLLAGILLLISMSGCGAGRNEDGKDLQRLSQAEIYSADGNLLSTVTDEDILFWFSSLDYTDIPSDTDAKTDALGGEMGDLNVLYTIVLYKTPASVYNDGSLEKLMELTVYKNSNIIKEQIVPEVIKGGYVAEEFLTFYITLSDEDKNFILSLAEPDQ